MHDVTATYRNATADELTELVGMSAVERRARIRELFASRVLVPVRGGSPEGEDDTGGGEGDDAGGQDDDDAAGADDDAGDDDVVPRSELEKAQRAAAEKDRELRERKRADEDRERREREAGGKFEELYKAERDKVKERDEQIAKLETELDDERKGRGRDKSERLVLSALTAAGAWDAEIALGQIRDLEGIDSEAKAAKAAEALKKRKARLFDDRPTRQKRGGGEGERRSRDTDNEAFGPAKIRQHFAGQERR